MTTEIVSPQPGFSRAEQLFRDAENLDELDLVNDYLDLCSMVEEHSRRYMRARPTDLATACRFYEDVMMWNRDAWMRADHDRRIRMIEDQMKILCRIGCRHPQQAAEKTMMLIGECRNLIGQLRRIRYSVLFDMTEDAFPEGESSW